MKKYSMSSKQIIRWIFISRCFLGRICSLQKYKRIIISERYRESAQKLEGAGNSCNGI